MTKTEIKKNLIFFVDQGKLIVENRKGKNANSRRRLPYKMKAEAFTNNLIPTLFSASLQINDMDKDLKLFQKLSKTGKYLPEELPLWLLEYEEFWELISDNLYLKLPFGRRRSVNKQLLKKEGLNPGSKKVNIDGFITEIFIVIDLNSMDFKEIFKKANLNKQLPIKAVLYRYKNLKYYCSYGPHGMFEYGFIPSFPYKQLIRPDKKISGKIMSYFSFDSKHKYSLINPKSISMSNLINLIRNKNKISPNITLRIASYMGKEVEYLNIENLLKTQDNEKTLLKILEANASNKNMFEANGTLFLYDDKQLQELKDDITNYLIKKDVRDFIAYLDKLKPSLGINKSLIKSLYKKGFVGVLQPHQEIGVSWYWELYKKGSPGAILADEMGMGKTVQTIAFLTAADVAKKKLLIVCPASVISAWEMELKKFNPQLADKIGSNITIMSYEKAARSGIKKTDFLILDEAQKIKNKNTGLFKAISNIEKEFVCILSGTPIENRIEDLFSILQVLDKSAYDLLYVLKKIYKTENELTQKVRKLIDPVYLQRKKSKEQLTAALNINIVKIKPTTLDLTLQKRIKQIFKDKLIKEKAANNHDFYSITAFTGLMRLRQAVSNPKQLPDELKSHFNKKIVRDINNIQPTKIKRLKELCSEIKKRQERVVIFAIFSETIYLLKEELEKSGHKVLHLTGQDSSTKRKSLIQEFQKPDSKYDVFIISLKAGNTGITLTNANNVIVYDLWYNPAVIAQALARVHRIGQQKNVNAYILVLEKTIDSDIHNIFLGKQELIRKFTDGGSTKPLSASKSALVELSKKIFK